MNHILTSNINLLFSFIIIGPIITVMGFLIRKKNIKLAKTTMTLGVLIALLGLYTSFIFVQGQKEVSDFKKRSQGDN